MRPDCLKWSVSSLNFRCRQTKKHQGRFWCDFKRASRKTARLAELFRFLKILFTLLQDDQSAVAAARRKSKFGGMSNEFTDIVKRLTAQKVLLHGPLLNLVCCSTAFVCSDKSTSATIAWQGLSASIALHGNRATQARSVLLSGRVKTTVGKSEKGSSRPARCKTTNAIQNSTVNVMVISYRVDVAANVKLRSKFVSHTKLYCFSLKSCLPLGW
jgi:hypothetical protein